MTIITYKNGVVAADRNISHESTFIVGTTCKLATNKDNTAIAAASGKEIRCIEFLRLFKNGVLDVQTNPFYARGKDEKGCGIVFYIKEDYARKTVYNTDGIVDNIIYNGIYAGGLCEDIAYGAMYAGANAIEAIRICTKLYPIIGGGIDCLGLANYKTVDEFVDE